MSATEAARQRVAELEAAFGLLTRLPARPFRLASPDSVSDAVWAFPIVGAIVGAIGAIVYYGLERLGAPPLLAALFALAAEALATGALHEDGLADCADGLGGASRDRRLAIMRDHVIGTYGTLALIFAIGMQAVSIEALAAPASVATVLIGVGAVSRLAPVLILASHRAARSDGLSVSVGRPGNTNTALSILVGFLIAWIMLGFANALLATLISALIALAVGGYARVKLGGQTGDVLGASVVLTEVIGLAAFACLAG